MDKIAVLIPCYNEAASIRKVIADFKHVIPDASIYVYDNNSTDDTSIIAEEAGAIVRHEPRQGKGSVVRRMFQDIDAECYILVDGDDTYPAEDSPKMSAYVLNENVDMVTGDRLSSTYFHENKRPFHNFGNSIVRMLINHIFRTNIQDIMTGYRAMSYRFVKSFPVVSQGFEIETEMTIHAVDKNMCIKNHIVAYRDRAEGSTSKLRTIPDGLKVIRTIFQLFSNYEPFKFFGLVGVILAALSIMLFVPVLNDYMHTGLVERIPTFIVCGLGGLSALCSFFAGVILQSMKRKERREFEFRLQQIHQWRKITKGEVNLCLISIHVKRAVMIF